MQRGRHDYGAAPAGGIGKLPIAESGNFPEIARFFLEEPIEPWYRLPAQAVERGIARGKFRPVDVPVFVRVLGAPPAMPALWRRSCALRNPQPLDLERYLAVAVDAALAALRPSPARSATKRTIGDANCNRRRKTD